MKPIITAILALLLLASTAPASFIEFEGQSFSGSLAQNGQAVTLSVTNHGKHHLTAFEVIGMDALMLGSTNQFFAQTKWFDASAEIEPLLGWAGGGGKFVPPSGIIKPVGIKQGETALFVFMLLDNPSKIIDADLALTFWEGYSNPNPLSAEMNIVPTPGALAILGIAGLIVALFGRRREAY